MNETVGTATASLLDLQSRVRAATGPDVALNEAIMALFYVRDERFIGEQEDSGPGGSWVKCKTAVWVDPKTDKWVSTAPNHFTGSIDAALGLVERVLPGSEYNLSTRNGASDAEIDTRDEQGFVTARYDGWHKDPKCIPLAILDALLSALIAQSTSARKGAVLQDSTLLEKE